MSNPTGQGSFARLIPINSKAIALVSHAIGQIRNTDDAFGQLKYFVPVDLDPEECSSIPELSGRSSTIDGFFQLSLDPTKQPKGPQIGWLAGRGRHTSDQTHVTYVDFVLGQPRGTGRVDNAISAVHLKFQFHQSSGALLIHSMDPEKSLRIQQGGSSIELISPAKRVLFQPTIIHLDDAKFQFEYTLHPSETGAHFEELKSYYQNFLKIKHPRFFPFVPGFDTTSISCLDAAVSPFVLSGGTFGMVKEAVDLSSGDGIAVKTIRHDPHNQRGSSRDEIVNEWEIARRFSGKPGIIETLSLVCDHGKQGRHILKCDQRHEYIHIVTQLGLKSFTNFPWDEALVEVEPRLDIFKQTLIGINEMHKAGYAHRDIQIGNLLVLSLSPPQGCILDFGKAVKIPKDGELRGKGIGPVPFVAPEVWCREHYTEAVDIFSWAIAIGQTIGVPLQWAGKINRRGLETYHFDLANFADFRPEYEPLIRMLQQILVWDPEGRISIDEALAHDCWAGVSLPTSTSMPPNKRQRMTSLFYESSSDKTGKTISTVPFSSEA